MGTIAQEITRINTAKSNIKTSIEAKGVQVPSDALISTYSGYIDQIQTGGGGTNLEEFTDARYLFYKGRFYSNESDLFSKFVGNACNLLCTDITDTTKKFSLATLNKWITKTFDNIKATTGYTIAYINGMINGSTVYAGDTLTFDYSNYSTDKDIDVILTGFVTTAQPNNVNKLVFNFDNSGVQNTGKLYISMQSGFIIGNTPCPHIEIYGNLSDNGTTYSMSSITSSSVPHFYDKVVLKNLNANIDKTVSFTSAKSSATSLATWQNSLPYYADNVGKVTIRLGTTRYNEIANTQLETDYNNYNVYFTT